MKPESRAPAGCPEVRRWLQVYLDDELHDRHMVIRLSAHLDACRKCGEEARTLADLKSCLRRWQPPADPAAVRRLLYFAKSLAESGPSQFSA